MDRRWGPRDGGREMHGGEDGTGRDGLGGGREVDGRVSWPRLVAVGVGVAP